MNRLAAIFTLGVVFALAACCLMLSACTSTHGPSEVVLPDDFSFDYHYSAGALPPQGYYALDVSADIESLGSRAMISGFLPDGPCSLAMFFDTCEDSLLVVYRQMLDNRIFRDSWTEVACPDGGAGRWLEVVASGREYHVPPLPGCACLQNQASLNETCDRIWLFVPAAVRDSLMSAHEGWMEEWK